MYKRGSKRTDVERAEGVARAADLAQGHQELKRVPDQKRRGEAGRPERLKDRKGRNVAHTDRDALLCESRSVG